MVTPINQPSFQTINAQTSSQAVDRQTSSQSLNAKWFNLEKNIKNVGSFLNFFNKNDEELLNVVMRKVFTGVRDAFEEIQREVGQKNDCHFSGLSQINDLTPRIEKLSRLYEVFDHAGQVQSRFDKSSKQLEHLFQHHNNAHKGQKAILKCFQELHANIKAAQSPEFQKFSTFQKEMENKHNWMTSIVENAVLFPRPKSLDHVACASTFLSFIIALFSEESDKTLNSSGFSDFCKSLAIPDNTEKNNLQQFLKEKILPNKIQKLKSPQLFFHFLKKIAINKKISIASWDTDWAKNNWKKHLSQFPHHVLLALSAYETRQLNQVLKKIWENLLKSTSIRTHDQWPICAQLLHTVKNNPSAFLLAKTENDIYEIDPDVNSIVEELVTRNTVYNSMRSLQERMSRCCLLPDKLHEQLTMIGTKLITYPQPMTEEQLLKLENASRIFRSLMQDAEQSQSSTEDTNFLIEFVAAVCLSDFYSVPSRKIELNRDLIDSIATVVQSPRDATPFYSLKTSNIEFVFHPCSIQAASRNDVAAEIGRILKLPVSDRELVNYIPLEMKKELRNLIKEWQEKVGKVNQSSEFDEFTQRLEGFPSPFASQIKDFIGRCISGDEKTDQSNLGDEYLKKISGLPLDEAKNKMNEVIVMIRNYSHTKDFKNACTKYDQSHPPLIGLAFPDFDTSQSISLNFEKRSVLPTTFKHLWLLYNLVTGNMETQDSCRLFLLKSKEDPSLFSFIELSSYFSSDACSYQNDLALDVPFKRSLLETLSVSQIFKDIKTQLQFKAGLASDPLEKAKERVEKIKTVLEQALDKDIAITPKMLISQITTT